MGKFQTIKTNLCVNMFLTFSSPLYYLANVLVWPATITTTTTQSAYAYSQKKDNGKGNGNGNTVTIEECKNKGSASGFDTALDQECENVICTHPGSGATCVTEGAEVSPVSNQTGGGGGGVCNSPLIEAHVGSTAGPLICANPSDITEPDTRGLCGGSDRVDLFVDSTHLCLSLGRT
jgi:hypothetical protein